MRDVYSMKTWMFKHPLRKKRLRDICCFVHGLYIYVKLWFTASASCFAPRIDMQLFKRLIKYKENEDKKRQIKLQIKKLSNHLWYFSKELITFAIFDKDVSIETKNKIIEALDNPSEPNHIKRLLLITKSLN